MEINQEKLNEKLVNMPNIETQIGLSKDKKWVLVKTTITKILSKNYFDVMFKDESNSEDSKGE